MSLLDSPERMLFARLQLADPAARSLLLTSVRGEAPVGAVAERLQSTIVAAGHAARLADRPTVSDNRARVQTSDEYEIVAAPGVLTDGHTLLLAAHTDLTILVVRRGHTSRRELDTVRRELTAAGARLAVAVLIE